MNLVSILFGIVAFLVVILTAIVPFLGALGAWIGLGIAAVGLVIGLLSPLDNGRNINLVAAGLAVLRIMIGGGFI